MLVLKVFNKNDKIYVEGKSTTKTDRLYNAKVNEKLKSIIHAGHRLAGTTDLQEQDRQTFVQSNTDRVDPVISQEKWALSRCLLAQQLWQPVRSIALCIQIVYPTLKDPTECSKPYIRKHIFPALTSARPEVATSIYLNDPQHHQTTNIRESLRWSAGVKWAGEGSV